MLKHRSPHHPPAHGLLDKCSGVAAKVLEHCKETGLRSGRDCGRRWPVEFDACCSIWDNCISTGLGQNWPMLVETQAELSRLRLDLAQVRHGSSLSRPRLVTTVV